MAVGINVVSEAHEFPGIEVIIGFRIVVHPLAQEQSLVLELVNGVDDLETATFHVHFDGRAVALATTLGRLDFGLCGLSLLIECFAQLLQTVTVTHFRHGILPGERS